MSDSTKFTPGPWTVHFAEGTKVRDAREATVASLSHTHLSGRRDSDEVFANARLIAAAPCMFEALRKIDGGWISDDIDEEDLEATIVEFQKIARAALAKARGETSLDQAENSDAL